MRRRGFRGAYPAAGGAAPEVPETIPDLYRWWRADSGVSTVGGVVDSWTDLVAGATLSQSTASARPTPTTHADLGGRDCLLFDGADDDLVSDEAASVWRFLHDGTGMTVFLVARQGAASNNHAFCWTSMGRLFGVAGVGTRWAYRSSITDIQGYVANASAQILLSTSGTWSDNTALWRSISYTTGTDPDASQDWSGASAVTANDTGTPDSGDSADTLHVGGTHPSLGAGSGFVGHLAEIIFYDRELTPSEIADLATYANTRYGVAV